MKFDNTLNIPSLVAIAVAVGSGAVAYSNSNERHAKNEVTAVQQSSRQTEQALRLTDIEQRLTADRKEFKDDVLRALDEIKRDVRNLQPQNNRR